MIYISTGGRNRVCADATAAEYLAAGLHGVELSGGRSKPDLCAAVLALKQSTPHSEFQVHNYFPPPEVPFVLNLASLDAGVANASQDHVRRAVQLGVQLGTPRYSFHAGFLIDPGVSELGLQIQRRELSPRAQALDVFMERVRLLAAWASEEGAELLVENNVLSARNLSGFGRNPLLMVDEPEITAVMQQMPRNVGLLLDVAHLKVSARTLGFDAVEALTKLKPLIRGYHLSDNDGTADSNEAVHAASWFWPHIRRDLDYYSLEVYRLPTAELVAQHRLAEREIANVVGKE